MKVIKDIELANISRFRGELMGAAMLFVILFHVSLPRADMFYGLRRMGNIGVDIFLFLSGVGLWFSWMKHDGGQGVKSLLSFYRRRFLRIYPTWLIVAVFYFGFGIFGGAGKSENFVDFIGDLAFNWDFWLRGKLQFWYISAIMMLYVFAPFYMMLIMRHPVYRWLPVVMIMWCILVQWVTPLHHTLFHLEIFWSRLPIFFIGINCGSAVREKRTLDGAAIWLILLMFGMALLSSIFLEQVRHGHFPLFVERMLYIPLTVTSVLLFNRLFRRTPKWFNGIFRFFGMLSLECYLIHDYFVLDRLEQLGWSYWPKFFVCAAITVPIAWLLHQFTKRIS